MTLDQVINVLVTVGSLRELLTHKKQTAGEGRQ